MAVVDFDMTLAAQEERAKYRRHFARFDMLFFLLCALVGLEVLGTVASYGAQGFTWMVFLVVLFFVPYGLLTAELGSTFTEEGAPYTWTRMAFGRFAAAVNQVPSWFSTPIWLGGTLTITAIATVDEFLFKLDGAWKYLFAIGFIWFAILTAILSLDVGKWIPTIGAIWRIVIIAFFTITVIVYAAKHGVHGFGAGDFKPTYALFIAVIPVLVFSFVGFETPSAAGEEMKDPQRDVPVTVARAGVLTFLCYAVPVLAIMLVLPAGKITGLSGFLDAMKTVFTVYGGEVTKSGANLSGAGLVLGDIVAVGFVWTLATSAAAWIMAADRGQAVAGYDGAAPRFMGRISERFGTPVVVNILSGLIATVFMVLAFQLTGGNSGKYFSTVLGLAISTTTITYMPMFLALIVLRYNRYRDVPRGYRIPFGNAGAWVCSLLTVAFCLLGTASVIWPGFGTSDPASWLPEGWEGQRLGFTLTQLVPLVVMAAIGVIFYFIAAPTRRSLAPAEETLPQGSAFGVAQGS